VAQLADGELYIGEDAFGTRPHPRLVGGFLDPRYVAELAFRRVLGVFAAHAFGDERFDFLREVLLDFLGEVVVDLPAGEELSQPIHDGASGFGGTEDEIDALQHLLEAGDFALEVLDTRGGDFPRLQLSMTSRRLVERNSSAFAIRCQQWRVSDELGTA
jgi:hypothetical protein